jgi:small ligand-binding sensory domain FIST
LDGIGCSVASESGVDANEEDAGRRLGERFNAGPEERLLLIFYDSIKQPPTETSPPLMNASPPLISGIRETLNSYVPIVGAGVIGGFDFGPTHQFCGSKVADQSVVGALLSGDFKPYTRIMHGCTPKDGIYHTITKINGSELYALDGKPIVKHIDEIYGSLDWENQLPLKRLSIGVNCGEKFGDFREEVYVNRLIAGVLPNRSGIVIFEPDLSEGIEVQFMLRDATRMFESVRKNTTELMEEILAEGRKPLMGLYIDCAGRTAAFSDTTREEAAEVQEILNRHGVPFLGFYSGVEVAPLLGLSRGLDWTGVLMVLTH